MDQRHAIRYGEGSGATAVAETPDSIDLVQGEQHWTSFNLPAGKPDAWVSSRSIQGVRLF